jgi:hypothetical protein
MAKKIDQDLLPAFRAGQTAAIESECGFLASSNSWEAWRLGFCYSQLPASAITELRKSRGYTMRFNGMLYRIEGRMVETVPDSSCIARLSKMRSTVMET